MNTFTGKLGVTDYASKSPLLGGRRVDEPQIPLKLCSGLTPPRGCFCFFKRLLGWGVAAVALCVFTSAATYADIVILDNLGTPYYNQTAYPEAQQFTMPSSTSADINSLTLELNFAQPGSTEVYLYNSDFSTQLADLGSVSTTSTGDGQELAVSLTSQPLLSAGITYNIAEVPVNSGTVGWDYVYSSTASGGSGTFGDGYYLYKGTWYAYASIPQQMSLTVAPEVPMTGMVMGFGALAIAVGSTFLRRFRRTASRIG